MSQYTLIRCEWCEKEEHFMDEEPTESGWLILLGPEENEAHFCSEVCLLAHL